MKDTEIAAFDAGVHAALDLAQRSGKAMQAMTILKPTRYNFAAEALLALAQEGRALLKGGDGATEAPMPAQPPRKPAGSHGVELVVPAHAGDDGNFGLSDEEIMRPSRETIVAWLSGRYPMLASHWSGTAARMLRGDAPSKTVAAK